MNEVLKALGFASAILITSFFGRDFGLSDGQTSALIVILIGASVSVMRSGKSCGSC